MCRCIHRTSAPSSARWRRVEVSELQAALVQYREDLALKEALLLATDAQLAAARQALTAAQVSPHWLPTTKHLLDLGSLTAASFSTCAKHANAWSAGT